MSALCPRRRLMLGGIGILGLTAISIGAWRLPCEKVGRHIRQALLDGVTARFVEELHVEAIRKHVRRRLSHVREPDRWTRSGILLWRWSE